MQLAQQQLKNDGLFLLHTIGSSISESYTNPWIDKYIFPGGYIPALSEVVSVIESCGLLITDIEILRLHYAETCRIWRERFMADPDIPTMFDGRTKLSNEVVEEVRGLFEGYEQALIDKNVDVLDATFWKSPYTIRLANHEHGYGFDRIHAHRVARGGHRAAGIHRLAEAGKAVIIVSSEFEELLAVSHRIIVMRDGQQIAERLVDDTDEHDLTLLAAGKGKKNAAGNSQDNSIQQGTFS